MKILRIKWHNAQFIEFFCNICLFIYIVEYLLKLIQDITCLKFLIVHVTLSHWWLYKVQVMWTTKVTSFPIMASIFATNPWAFQSTQIIKLFDIFLFTLRNWHPCGILGHKVVECPCFLKIKNRFQGKML